MITCGSEQSNSIVLHCVKNLGKVGAGRAKASMISLLRQFTGVFPTLAKETFRRLVAGYLQERDEAVKLEIINLGTQV